MDVNVCIPTLRSYVELGNCIESIKRSTIAISRIIVIDNGGTFTWENDGVVSIIKMPRNYGVAYSWNKFIAEVPEHRIICNDDITFEPTAIEKMIAAYDPNNLIFPMGGLESVNAFSCFLLPQPIIDVVGLFDENISPNYAYFEDNDYHRRMRLAGFDIKGCDAAVHHVQSSTIRNFNSHDRMQHHSKFKFAQARYIKKWGGLPGEEVLTEPMEI